MTHRWNPLSTEVLSTVRAPRRFMASHVDERASRSATIASTPPSVLYGLKPEFTAKRVTTDSKSELTIGVSVKGFKQYTYSTVINTSIGAQRTS